MTTHEYSALLVYELMAHGFTAERGPNPIMTKLTHSKKKCSVYVTDHQAWVEFSAYLVTRRVFHMCSNERSHPMIMVVVKEIVRSLKLV